MQISEVSFKVCFVGLPPHPVNTGCGIAFEREERLPEQVHTEVVKERGELFVLPLPCGLPYAVERLCHTNPALCPVRALLFRVPLGPRPLLGRLRSIGDFHRLRLVRRLPSSYGGV